MLKLLVLMLLPSLASAGSYSGPVNLAQVYRPAVISTGATSVTAVSCSDNDNCAFTWVEPSWGTIDLNKREFEDYILDRIKAALSAKINNDSASSSEMARVIAFWMKAKRL